MKPVYRIMMGGNSVDVNDRAVKISVVDNAGNESDTFRLVIDNRDYKVKAPEKGRELQIYLGLQPLVGGSINPFSGMMDMGTFEIESTEFEGPPHQLVVTGKAASFKKMMKSQRTGIFEKEEAKLKKFVEKIAQRNGLQAVVDQELGQIDLGRLDQTGESDFHILTRIAREVGALWKPTRGKLLFVKHGEGTSASGGSTGSVTLTESDFTSYRVKHKQRPHHDKIKKEYHDSKTGERKFEEKQNDGGGSGGNTVHILRHLAANRSRAKAEVNAELRRLRRLEGEMSGNIRFVRGLRAGDIIRVSSFFPDIDGEWHAKTVTTNFNSEDPALHMTIECELPGTGKKGSS